MPKIFEYEQVIELSGQEIFLVDTPDGTRTMTYAQLVELITATHNTLISSDLSESIKGLIQSGEITLADFGMIADAEHISYNDETTSLDAANVQNAIEKLNNKSGNSELELINSGTQTDAVLNFIVSNDSAGNSLHLKRMKWVADYAIDTGDITFGEISINGQGKDAFLNVSSGMNNRDVYFLQPLTTFPPETFKAYGNTTDTITADKTKGCEVHQEYEFWLDESNTLNASSVTRCYAYDSTGTKYPVFLEIGGIKSFQKTDFIQKCGFDFSAGIETLKMEFLYTTGRNFTWKIYGERIPQSDDN